MKSTLSLLAVLVLLSACDQAAEGSKMGAVPAEGQIGRWVTASGNLEVEIAPCEHAICGTVVKVLANQSMSQPEAAMPPADPQAALGMKILTGFVPSGSAEWSGEIYNRENGKTYSCVMTLTGQDELKVRPYVVLPLFGKTQVWHRVAAAASSAK
jgi:uncharacterized protein (DUF2147 family)